MANTAAPLSVSVDPDPLVLERVVTSRRLGTFALKEGNGFGGNGHNGENGENGHNGENGNGHNGTDGNSSSNSTGGYASPLSAAMGGITGLGSSLFGRRAPTSQIFATWGDDEPSPDPAPQAGNEPASQTGGMASQEPASLSEQPLSFSSPLSPSYQVPSQSAAPAAPDQSGQMGIANASSPDLQQPPQPAAQPPAVPSAASTAPWEVPKPTSPFGMDAFASGAAAAQNFFSSVLPASASQSGGATSDAGQAPQVEATPPGAAAPQVEAPPPAGVAPQVEALPPAGAAPQVEASLPPAAPQAEARQTTAPAPDVLSTFDPAPAPRLSPGQPADPAPALPALVGTSSSPAQVTLSAPALDSAPEVITPRPVAGAEGESKVESPALDDDDDLARVGPTAESEEQEQASGMAATAIAAAAGAVAGALTGAVAGAAFAAGQTAQGGNEGGQTQEAVLESQSPAESAEPAPAAPDAEQQSMPQDAPPVAPQSPPQDALPVAPSPDQSSAPAAAPGLAHGAPAAQSNDFFSLGPDALRKGGVKSGQSNFSGGGDSQSSSANDSFFTATANDFFTAAPIPKPKMESGVAQREESISDGFAKPSQDDLFPDDSHLRGSKEKAAVKESEDRPKVARPKGFMPKDEPEEEDTGKVKLTEKGFYDKDDDEQEEPEEEKTPPPARRSFSSKEGAAQAKTKSKSRAAAGSKEDDEDASSEEKEDSEDEAPVAFLDQEVNVLGLSLTRKTAGILTAVFLTISIIVFNTFCTIFTTLAGNFSNLGNHAANVVPQHMQPVPDISGLYELRYNTELDPKGGAWQLEIQQNGNQFFARGEDRGGPWGIQGKIAAPDKFGFEKYYIKNGKAAGKPLIYYGRYWLDELQRPAMTGQLQFDVHKGVFLHSKWVTIKGKFQMRQIVSGAVLAANRGGQQQQVAMGTAPAAQSKGGGFNPLTLLHPDNQAAPKRPGDMSGFFMNVAGVLIAIGVFIALVFLWIFGPSGKLNILAKQKYIPSQYQAQHNKMVGEWAKGLHPGGVPLGNRVEWRVWKPWQTKTLAMPPQSRTVNPHILVMGGSDKGKTRFVANMITHDIQSADRAVVVIDSDGELTDLVIRWVASHSKGKDFAKRICVIDPTYKGGSLSYNPLEVPDDGNMIDAASAIVHGFKAIYTEPPGSQSQWNQQTANILRNAAILLMANNKTLTDLPTLLQDNDFRDILLEGVEKKKRERTEYGTLLETWGQYKRLARTDQWITWSEPILNRVTPMLSDPRIRPILTKPVGDLRLRELIKNKLVLLVRIPQGQLDQNANLLGSLLVTGLKQAALSLADGSSNKTRPVALYLDELNNFIEKETIEALTQETAKFQIGFVGCCKTLQHLPEDFRNNMVINMGTICAFALAKKDGDMLGPQMFRVDGRKIKHQTIQNFFNKVNTSPQFELISDEEKLNIDRVVGQEERHYFCYKVGTVAGTFCLKTHDFPDINDNKVSAKLIEQMHKGAPAESSKKKKST